MDQGLEWYHREPRAFLDGVQGMGPELIGAYAVLLDLIYARGGRTIRDDRHLAGILGCSMRKAAALTDRLLDQHKITLEDGFITNSRAKREAKSRRNIREAQSEGGRDGAEKRWRGNKNKGLAEGQPIADLMPDKTREEKKGGGGGSAHAREAPIEDDPAPFGKARTDPMIDRIAEAAGADLSREGWLDFNVAQALRRWRELTLTDEEILAVVRHVAERKTDGPATSPAYFDKAMQRAAGLKQRPGLTPIDGGKSHDGKSARERKAEQELADDLAFAADLERRRREGG